MLFVESLEQGDDAVIICRQVQPRLAELEGDPIDVIIRGGARTRGARVTGDIHGLAEARFHGVIGALSRGQMGGGRTAEMSALQVCKEGLHCGARNGDLRVAIPTLGASQRPPKRAGSRRPCSR